MKWKVFWRVWLVSVLLVSSALAQDEEVSEVDTTTNAGATRYIDLKPAFIVNYGGVGRLRYLKTDIALRVGGGDKGVSAIRHHMPQVRHQLVMLLSKASEEDVSSVEGRELLRQNALEAVKKVVLEEEGEEQVVDLLFSSFIVQR